MTFTANGKNETLALCIFVFAVNSKRHFFV